MSINDKKSDNELWMEQMSKGGSVMATSLLNLTSNFHPEAKEHYFKMVREAIQGIQASIAANEEKNKK